MRLIRTLLLAALMVVPAVYAQTLDSQKTVGMLNGRFWERRAESDRLYFVLGFCEAGIYAIEIPKENGPLCPASATFGEIMNWITNFYSSHPEYMRLPIADAIGLFKLRASGDYATDIDRKAADLIRIYDKPK